VEDHAGTHVSDSMEIKSALVKVLRGKSQGRFDSAFQRILWYRAFKKRTANMSRLHQRRWKSQGNASPLDSV